MRNRDTIEEMKSPYRESPKNSQHLHGEKSNGGERHILLCHTYY